MPHELIECWTLEERPLLGSLRHMAPIRKRLSVLLMFLDFCFLSVTYVFTDFIGGMNNSS